MLRVATAYLVVAWLAAQIAETILPAFGFGDAAVRWVVIAFAAGFVPALLLAWVFDWTSAGIRKDTGHADASTPPASTRGFDRILIAILALALGFFAFDKLTDRAPADPAEQSIAVLPFLNLSGDVENAYFSDGIAEELLNLLARLPQLRVISRTSSFTYRDSELSMPEVARQLNVTHILEGSVRRSGDRVRITAQLIHATADRHLWSRTFDRALDDVFGVQDEIATLVMRDLQPLLATQLPKSRPIDPRAYGLYLQAAQTARRGDADGMAKAIRLYQAVLAIDDQYAPAWVGIATTTMNQVSKRLVPRPEGFRKAREATGRALQIDAEFARAHASLGFIALSENDLAAAAMHYQRALALAPTDLATIGDAVSVAAFLGRLEEAVRLDEYQVSRDPINPTGLVNLGVSYTALRRWSDAIVSFERALTLSPQYRGARYLLGLALLGDGRAAQALAAFEAEAIPEYQLLGIAMAQEALGNRSASDAALKVLIAEHAQDWAYNIAYVYAFRQQPDDAFAWLNRAVANNDGGLAEIPIQPLFASLFDDDRWLPFLRSIGKAPEQLAAIAFEITPGALGNDL